MPKISRHGGPSDASGMTDYPVEPIRREEIRGNGGAPSVGNNSTQSAKSEPPSSESETASRQPHAPTTENPSNPPDKDDSTVHSTGGNTRETSSPRSAKKAAAKKATKSRRSAGVRSTDTDGTEDDTDDDWE